MNKKFNFRWLFFTFFLFSVSFFIVKNDSLMPAVNAQTSREITSNKNASLNVSMAFWTQQRDKFIEDRKAPVGDKPKGLVIPKDFATNTLNKQKAKLSEMIADGYVVPVDFTELAEKRMSGELVEIPLATESYFIEVGGNADDSEFTSFDFDNGSVILKPDAPKYIILKKLADDFDGMKYDLQKSSDRRQMKIRLLRMLNPQTKVILEEIAAAYQKQFKRPLKVTSMIRSIEYQVNLSKVDSSSFLVRGKGALPPHVSGCAFDLGRKQMTAVEQNFILKNLTELEKNSKITAQIEYGASSVFHVFVYLDGKLPKV